MPECLTFLFLWLVGAVGEGGSLIWPLWEEAGIWWGRKPMG